MWFSTKVGLTFLKAIAPLFYIGKRKFGNTVHMNFRKNIKFATRVNSQDLIILHEIFKAKCYEKAKIRKNDVVVDIGAHIGGYSILATKLGGKVFAYEAMPENYELLVENLKINNCKRVKSYNVAVNSKKGEVLLNVDRTGNGLHSIYPDSSSKETIKVPSIDLHEIFVNNRLNQIDVLKIDVEGAEYEIILHARPEDLQKIKTIIMEYHDYFDHGHNNAELKSVLIKNGFAVKDISSWHQNVLFKSGVILASRERLPN